MNNVVRARIGSSLLRLELSIFGAVVFALASSGVAHAILPQILVNSAKAQIVKSPTNFKNQLNISATFTNNGDDGCAGDDPIADGISVGIFSASCASPDLTTVVSMDGFVPHVIGHQSFGIFYAAEVGVVTISARLTKLPTPISTCGRWTLNFEGTGSLFTDLFEIGDTFGVVIQDADGDINCLDLPAADVIIGNSLH